jgi:hypothetical protein
MIVFFGLLPFVMGILLIAASRRPAELFIKGETK